MIIYITLATAIAGTGAVLTYTYQQLDVTTMSSKTLVSNFDIPSANLIVSQIGSSNRYEVTIASEAGLSSGALPVQLLFGNASTGVVSRIAYGTFGAQARIGGANPLQGTAGEVLDGSDNFVAAASASFGTNSLVLDVDTNDLAGATLLHAEVYGTDTPEGIGTFPLWINLSSKILLDAFPSGGVVLPNIPGAGMSLALLRAGAVAPDFIQPAPASPRNITPP